MRHFLPTIKETRLVKMTPAEIRQRFDEHVRPIDKPPEEDEHNYIFNGAWKDDLFTVSLRLKNPGNFIPLVHIRIIPSEEDLLLKFEYDLFPATRKLLFFWTIVPLFITVFFIGAYDKWLYGAISFSFAVVNYILSRENFKMEVRKTRRALDKFLS